jgi:hypothetical protein
VEGSTAGAIDHARTTLGDPRPHIGAVRGTAGAPEDPYSLVLYVKVVALDAGLARAISFLYA